jgi:hypothetical protein
MTGTPRQQWACSLFKLAMAAFVAANVWAGILLLHAAQGWCTGQGGAEAQERCWRFPVTLLAAALGKSKAGSRWACGLQ